MHLDTCGAKGGCVNMTAFQWSHHGHLSSKDFAPSAEGSTIDLQSSRDINDGALMYLSKLNVFFHTGILSTLYRLLMHIKFYYEPQVATLVFYLSEKFSHSAGCVNKKAFWPTVKPIKVGDFRFRTVKLSPLKKFLHLLQSVKITYENLSCSLVSIGQDKLQCILTTVKLNDLLYIQTNRKIKEITSVKNTVFLYELKFLMIKISFTPGFRQSIHQFGLKQVS